MPALQCITLLKKHDSWGLNISFLNPERDLKKLLLFIFFYEDRKVSNLRITLLSFTLALSNNNLKAHKLTR